MNEEWKITQEDALRGAEDFRAICAAIRKLSAELSSTLAVFVTGQNGCQVPIAVEDAFSHPFQQYQHKAEESFLSGLRRTGSAVSDNFESHLQQIQSDEEKTKIKNFIKLNAWRTFKGIILEVLVLLSTLVKLRPVRNIELPNAFSPSIPIPVDENGNPQFIWCQPSISDSTSGMLARPDIVIATSDQSLDEKTIISIVECKCRSQLNAQDIRKEFGKAYDLKVQSYTILSYYETPQRLKDAAKKLGIDLKDFGLGTDMRDEYLTGQRDLGHDLAETLEEARRAKSFVKTLQITAAAAVTKGQ
jgi:hypothetical protein